MNRFWDFLIRPALEASGAREIVEIGSEGGKHTQRLLDWCASRGARLHVIEPVPAYDAEKLRASYPDTLVFHCATSLEILDGLGPIDAILIDGDHNWYTVYHELKALEKVNGTAFPLVFLHDVAWPFARRDMYYAPARIPGEHRQPYRTGALRRGQDALLKPEEPGLAPELYKAEHEGGPRNGVLTAVEDFMRESGLALRLETVPVGFGLGILATESLQARRPELRAILDQVRTPEFGWRVAVHTEERRVDELVELRHEYGLLHLHLAYVSEEFGRHQKELGNHQVEVERLRELLGSAYGHAQALERHVEELRQRIAQQDAERASREAELARAQAEIDTMRSSRSWRLTAPLRRLSTRVKGGEQSS